MPPKSQRVWMEIAIGNQQEYDTQLEAYNRACEFFVKAGTYTGMRMVGPRIGLELLRGVRGVHRIVW